MSPPGDPDLPTKPCASCGRVITWRRKWVNSWDSVRYCSDRCRRHKPDDLDQRLERAILELLAERPVAATLCPSEAARRVDPAGWRDLMERTRAAARRLVAADKVQILQRGRPVDPSTAKGPIRIGRSPRLGAQ